MPCAWTQWRRMWLTMSFYSIKRKHRFTRDHPLLYSWFNVKTFPREASYTKTLTLARTIGFQIAFKGKVAVFSCSRKEWKDFSISFPFLLSFQSSLSFSFLPTTFPWSLEINSLILSNSQSFRFLEKWGFQSPPSLWWSQSSTT